MWEPSLTSDQRYFLKIYIFANVCEKHVTVFRKRQHLYYTYTNVKLPQEVGLLTLLINLKSLEKNHFHLPCGGVV
jgi:hypothetical protein